MEIESSEDVDRQEIKEYLGMKGAVRLLIVLGSGGRQNKELKEELNISSSTLYKRLDEGTTKGLITAEIGKASEGHPKLYVLTPLGKAINNQMLGMHLPQVYWEFKAREEQFDGLVEGLQEWVLNADEEFQQQVDRHIDAEDTQS